MKSHLACALLALVCTVCAGGKAQAQTAPLSFGVVSQRSAVQTAQYWNPILQYLSRASGVPLQIKLTRSGTEHAAMVGRGEFDFLYSNHNFAPGNDRVGYIVFARPLGTPMRGQLIVAAGSSLRAVSELKDKRVAFPSTAAFAGYMLPMDALQRAGVQIQPQFAGTQEGALTQLTSGRAQAAGVNSEIARNFSSQQKFRYRVLWSSEEYPGIPVSAHPRVPKAQRDAVRDALLNMARDPVGLEILRQSAALAGENPPYGYTAADNQDYDCVQRLYRNQPTQGNKP